MPALAMADYVPMTPTGGNLGALCETCGGNMHKRISLAVLDALKAKLDIRVLQHERHIREPS